MYRNNKKIQHLTHGAMAIMMLIGSNAMAADTGVVPVQVTDNLQRLVVESLAGQNQESSDALIAIESVPVAQPVEWSMNMEVPHTDSPAQLAEDSPDSLHFSLQDWQPQQNTAKYLGQIEG